LASQSKTVENVVDVLLKGAAAHKRAVQTARDGGGGDDDGDDDYFNNDDVSERSVAQPSIAIARTSSTKATVTAAGAVRAGRAASAAAAAAASTAAAAVARRARDDVNGGSDDDVMFAKDEFADLCARMLATLSKEGYSGFVKKKKEYDQKPAKLAAMVSTAHCRRDRVFLLLLGCTYPDCDGLQ
jgi:hypothetical protein